MNCDTVYAERDRLVAFLSRLYPAHLAVATDAEPGWNYVVCIHTPAGQMAWHVPDSEIADLFGHLVALPNDWDGHTTDEKYRRLERLAGTGD